MQKKKAAQQQIGQVGGPLFRIGANWLRCASTSTPCHPYYKIQLYNAYSACILTSFSQRFYNIISFSFSFFIYFSAIFVVISTIININWQLASRFYRTTAYLD